MNSPHLENGCIKEREYSEYIVISSLSLSPSQYNSFQPCTTNSVILTTSQYNSVFNAEVREAILFLLLHQRGEYNLAFTALNMERWRKSRLDPYCGESHIFMVLTFHRKLLPAQVLDKTGNGTQVHSQLTLLGWLLQNWNATGIIASWHCCRDEQFDAMQCVSQSNCQLKLDLCLNSKWWAKSLGVWNVSVSVILSHQCLLHSCEITPDPMMPPPIKWSLTRARLVLVQR